MTELRVVPGLRDDDGVAGEVDPAWRLAARFVLSCATENTRRAYVRDIRAFYAWCAEVGVYPLTLRRADIDAYLRQLARLSRLTRGRRAASAMVARRLFTLAGLYRYAVEEGVIDRCPIVNVGRFRSVTTVDLGACSVASSAR